MVDFNQVVLLIQKQTDWNGTAWTEVNDLSAVKGYIGGAGAKNTSALAFGGSSPALSPTTTAATEEWSQSDTQIKTVTSS